MLVASPDHYCCSNIAATLWVPQRLCFYKLYTEPLGCKSAQDKLSHITMLMSKLSPGRWQQRCSFKPGR